MKKIIQFFIVISMVTLALMIGLFFTLRYHNKKHPTLFTTERLIRRALSQTVAATGNFKTQNPIKIGSIVSGVLKDLYIKENEQVTTGQLLATIDPGTGETDFEQAYNDFLKAQKEYMYRKNNFTRKTTLYNAQQLSQDDYELLEKDMLTAEYTVKSAKAKLNREKLLLSERNIYAPQEGFITKINASKGSGIVGSNVASSDPLIEIAPNITTIEISLNVDENDISLIKIGQKIKLTVNAYPDQAVFSTVKDIGFSPEKVDGIQFYKVCAHVNNPEKRFRPGMFLNAKIYIAEAENIQCIQGLTFQIDSKRIESIAKKLNYQCKALDKSERKKIKETNHMQRVKFVWIKKDTSFIQKPIILGITDDNYFEITEGVSETDDIITEIFEEDTMEKVYKNWFSGPL